MSAKYFTLEHCHYWYVLDYIVLIVYHLVTVAGSVAGSVAVAVAILCTRRRRHSTS